MWFESHVIGTCVFFRLANTGLVQEILLKYAIVFYYSITISIEASQTGLQDACYLHTTFTSVHMCICYGPEDWNLLNTLVKI